MLTCRKLSRRADAYLDGELGLWGWLRIRLHLSMCIGCTRFMDQMRCTRRLIKAEANAAGAADEARIDGILAALHAKDRPGA